MAVTELIITNLVWVAVLILLQIWNARRIYEVTQRVNRVIDVLSVAGPELNRRIVDEGTRVSTGYTAPWADEAPVWQEEA